MRGQDAAGRARLAKILVGSAALAIAWCIGMVGTARSATVCTDEIYAPKSATELGSWISSLGKGHVGCMHAGTYGTIGAPVYVDPAVAPGSETQRVKVRGYPDEPLPQIVGGLRLSASADYFNFLLLKVNGTSLGANTIGLAPGADDV